MTQTAAKPTRRRALAPVRAVSSRPRLFLCAALGLAALMLMPGDWRHTTRLLLAWNLGVLAYLAAILTMMERASHADMRQRAESQDETALVILVMSVCAALAGFAAIISELAIVKEMQGLEKALHITLAGVTIFTAWCFIHLMFALHYAHEFYTERHASGLEKEAARDPDRRGGLSFPATPLPDYSDFLYFSFVIGCACATADTDISSNPMRRIALFHGIIAFFFNVTVLALMINIAAGLI